MTELAMKIFDRYKARFMAYGDESVRDSFKGELIYESGRFYIVVFIMLFAWIPYIPTDLVIHQYPGLAVAIRIGLTLTGICAILLRFTNSFKYRPDTLLKIAIGYLFFFTAIVTGTSGNYAPSYIGGFIFILLLPIVGPFTTKYKFTLSSVSILLFFVSGFIAGLDFQSAQIAYSITDLAVVLVVSLVLSSLQNTIRYRAWLQRQELKDAVKQVQENIKTISDLAKKAEEASRSKSNFLATMSHEIRTPMNAIIGISQIEMQKADLPEKFAKAFVSIFNSGSSLLGIINDILDLSKIETGKMELNPVNYDLPSIINDTVQLNIVRIAPKPIEFILHVDENIPSRVIGDELRLKQILNNLLSNAIKYTEKGFVKLSVSHSEPKYSDCGAAGEIVLRFAVEDTGQGMKPEDKARLFTEYMRFNADANRGTEGTGIGLNIAMNLAVMMGGTIEVESEYGKGSTFILYVKQGAVECEPIGAELAERLGKFQFVPVTEHSRLQINREPMPYGSIIVVDDVETNLYVAEGLLFPYELKIETAASGFAVIEKVKLGAAYDIIFMDHMMPLMDGIETTQKLRAMGYKGTIVALTANALVGNAEMFLQSGFDGFISKPIDLRELDKTLNKFIRDKYAKESKKYNSAAAPPASLPAVFAKNPKLIKIFLRDAEKAAATLRETVACGDIKLFTITAHAMKSALLNIGKPETAQLAAALENAGLKGDIDFISANTETFVETLEALAQSLSQAETASEGDFDRAAESAETLLKSVNK